MTMNAKKTIEVGKAEITHSSWSNTITFRDVEGNERVIDDPVGHVMRLIEAILNGPGKVPQGNQRHDWDTDGLPAENLQVRGDGQGQPQWPHKGGQFLDGIGPTERS